MWIPHGKKIPDHYLWSVWLKFLWFMDVNSPQPGNKKNLQFFLVVWPIPSWSMSIKCILQVAQSRGSQQRRLATAHLSMGSSDVGSPPGNQTSQLNIVLKVGGLQGKIFVSAEKHSRLAEVRTWRTTRRWNVQRLGETGQDFDLFCQSLLWFFASCPRAAKRLSTFDKSSGIDINQQTNDKGCLWTVQYCNMSFLPPGKVAVVNHPWLKQLSPSWES